MVAPPVGPPSRSALAAAGRKKLDEFRRQKAQRQQKSGPSQPSSAISTPTLEGGTDTVSIAAVVDRGNERSSTLPGESNGAQAAAQWIVANPSAEEPTPERSDEDRKAVESLGGNYVPAIPETQQRIAHTVLGESEGSPVPFLGANLTPTHSVRPDDSTQPPLFDTGLRSGRSFPFADAGIDRPKAAEREELPPSAAAETDKSPFLIKEAPAQTGISQGTASMASLPSSISNGLANSSSRRADFADLERHIAELTEDRFALQRALTAAAERQAEMASEQEGMVAACNSQAARVEALRTEITNVQQRLAEALDREESVAQHRDDLIHAAMASEERAQNLAAEVVALEEKVLQLTSAALQQSHEGRSGSQQAQDEGMQRRLALAEAERTELSSNLDALKEENSALKDQLRAFFEADAQKDIEKQVPQPVVPDSFQQEEGKMPASPAVMLSPRSHTESQLPEAIRVLLPTSLLTVNEETGPALVESESVSTVLEGIFHLLRTLRGQQAEQTCRIREQQDEIAALQKLKAEQEKMLSKQQAHLEMMAQTLG